MLGVLIAVRGGLVEICGGLVVGGSVAVGRGGVVGGGGHGGSQGNESEESQHLKNIFKFCIERHKEESHKIT